jgi:hypothetical protein
MLKHGATFVETIGGARMHDPLAQDQEHIRVAAENRPPYCAGDVPSEVFRWSPSFAQRQVDIFVGCSIRHWTGWLCLHLRRLLQRYIKAALRTRGASIVVLDSWRAVEWGVGIVDLGMLLSEMRK